MKIVAGHLTECGPGRTFRSGLAKASEAVSAGTWIAVIGATLGAFMAVLNIQIVNVSVADIQGAIGAALTTAGGFRPPRRRAQC